MKKRQFKRNRKAWNNLLSKLKDTGHLTTVTEIEKGGLHILQIEHDDGCPMLCGGDICTCDETSSSLLQYHEKSKYDA